MRRRICIWSQALSPQDTTKGKTVTSQWRNLATILTEWSKLMWPLMDKLTTGGSDMMQHKGTTRPKCITWISLWGNIKQIKSRDVLQNNWPAPYKNVHIMNNKERLRHCSLLKGTKEAWQLNAIWTLDWIPPRKKHFFLIKDISHATAWINLEDIMLSEIIQSKKDKYCGIPLLWST